MRNNYLSLKGYFILLVLSLQFFNTKAQTTFTYNYTGAVQPVNLTAGTYEIQCWGANGSNGSWTNVPGGKGGYSKGTYVLSSATTIYVCIGGVGVRNTIPSGSSGGGYNGGGDGYDTYGTGGGGATHVSTASGLLSNTLVRSGLIIAAGGGGAASGWSGTPGLPGDGGGLTGSDGTPALGTPGLGGTQIAGGTQASTSYGNSNGTAGVGGSGLGNQGCGGGGGWYGGGGGPHASNGGGGSGYITGVTSGVSAQFSQTGFVAKPVVTGDGLVIITSLCNVGITATSSLICSGSSVTLTTNAVSNYTWSTGNTTTTSIVVSPAATTTYTLYGTGSNPAGCTSGAAITITVNNTPTVSINSTTLSACLGQTVGLTANGANTYTWSGGLGNNAAITVTPSANTGYTVTGTNACGTASAAVTVTVSALPILVSASSATVCAAAATTLNPGGATTYTWMPGSSTQTNYIVNPTANTVYTVTGKTGSCLGTNTLAIYTKPNPTITIVATATAICNGDVASLTANGGLTYTWNPVVSSNTTIAVSPIVSTLYSVVGINSVNCTASAVQVIVVRAKPAINVTASDPVICPAGSSTLTATGTSTSYVWTTGSTSSTTVVNPGVTTTYSVTGTGINTCSNDTVITVSVFDPTLTVSSSTAVCRGTNVNLSASGTDVYHWSTGSAFSSISVTPTITTTYTVDGSSTQGAVTCSVSGTVTVSVNPNPTVTASSSPTIICRGERAVVTASGAVTYTWAGSTPEVATSMTVTPTADQTYSVAGSDAHGCKGAGTVLLRVAGCVGIADHSLNNANISLYPNPSNGDFTISSDQAISLQISNELGQVIRTISISDTEKEVKINNLSAGVYFITGDNANGSVKQKLIITK